jgi:hypothetical protein
MRITPIATVGFRIGRFRIGISLRSLRPFIVWRG